MEYRTLGKTGLQLSPIGFGGFHLLEVPETEVFRLLNRYLDIGGNYIETAAGYGDGVSEQKIGRAVSNRRDDFVLATKCHIRDLEGARKTINRSLENLKTDHVDILFMHGIQDRDTLAAVSGPDGALRAAEEAKKAGKTRFIAISGHGRPDGMIPAVKSYDYDVLMTVFNYYDRFNFPQVVEELLPLCRGKGMGVLAMKPVADGFLYQNPEKAFRYCLGLDVDAVVTGANREDYLEAAFRAAENFHSMTEEELDSLFRDAPELGDYVCRLCGKCRTEDFDPRKVFLTEALFDRQMDRARVEDADFYALRERLKHWFHQDDKARTEYAAMEDKVDPEADYRYLNASCPYGIDIDRKLKIAHAKLSGKAF